MQIDNLVLKVKKFASLLPDHHLLKNNRILCIVTTNSEEIYSIITTSKFKVLASQIYSKKFPFHNLE